MFPPQSPSGPPMSNPFGGPPPMGGPPQGGLPPGGSLPPPGDPGMQDSPLLQALASSMGGGQDPMQAAGMGGDMGIEQLLQMLAMAQAGVGGGPDPMSGIMSYGMSGGH